MASPNTFYTTVRDTKNAGEFVLGRLAADQRSRLRAVLVDASPVTAVTINPEIRPASGTYFIEVAGTDTVTIDGARDITVVHDGSTINENVGGSGLDLVFSLTLTVGQSSEVRVSGDVRFPDIRLDMDLTGDGNTTDEMAAIDQSIGTLELIEALPGWYRLNPEKGRQLLNGQTVPEPARTITYTVSNYDTWATIEERFGVSWKVIVEANNIVPSDLATGLRLVIPLNIDDPNIRGLKVLGSHAGRQAWGKSIARAFEVTDTGDLRLLNATQTLFQDICIIIEDAGWRRLSEGFPAGVTYELLADNLKSALLADQRIRRVKALSIDRSEGGVLVNLQIYPIHQQSFNIMFRENDNSPVATCQCSDGSQYGIQNGVFV